MITVKITRLNDVDPLIQVFTSTGLPPIHPDYEKIEDDEENFLILEPRSITLKFNNINRIDGNSSKLMDTIDWYIRTYFILTTKFEILINQSENENE